MVLLKWLVSIIDRAWLSPFLIENCRSFSLSFIVNLLMDCLVAESLYNIRTRFKIMLASYFYALFEGKFSSMVANISEYTWPVMLSLAWCFPSIPSMLAILLGLSFLSWDGKCSVQNLWAVIFCLPTKWEFLSLPFYMVINLSCNIWLIMVQVQQNFVVFLMERK